MENREMCCFVTKCTKKRRVLQARQVYFELMTFNTFAIKCIRPCKTMYYACPPTLVYLFPEFHLLFQLNQY